MITLRRRAAVAPPIEVRLPGALRPEPGIGCVRLGGSADGGYVLPAAVLPSATWLLSCGLNDDCRFEADFARRTGVPVDVYDPSVTGGFWAVDAAMAVLETGAWIASRGLRPSPLGTGYLPYRRFFAGPRHRHDRRRVGDDGPGAVSVGTMLEGLPERGVVLKMDIEGWEWRVLDGLRDHRARFDALAIEFHDVDLHLPRLMALAAALAPDFAIVSTTANNAVPPLGDGTPVIVEVVWARRSVLATTAAGADAAGGTPAERLVQPNLRYRPALRVRFADDDGARGDGPGQR